MIEGNLSVPHSSLLHSTTAWGTTLQDLGTLITMFDHGLTLDAQACLRSTSADRCAIEDSPAPHDNNTPDDAEAQRTCTYCGGRYAGSWTTHCLLRCAESLPMFQLDALQDTIHLLTQHITCPWFALSTTNQRAGLVRAPFNTGPAPHWYNVIRSTLTHQLIHTIARIKATQRRP